MILGYFLVQLARVENRPRRLLGPISVVICWISMVSVVALPAEPTGHCELLVPDPNVLSGTNWTNVPAYSVSKSSSL